MLDKLVISKNNDKENRRLNGLFSGTIMLAAIGLTLAFTISLFGFQLGLDDSDLELSSLTMPIAAEETKPEPPKMQKQTQSNEKVKTDVPTRVANIQRLDETPAKSPDTVSTTPSKNLARPNSPFKIGKIDVTPINSTGIKGDRDQEGKVDGKGISNNQTNIIEKDEEIPVLKPTVKEPKKDIIVKNPPIVSRGVVNGSAKYLAQPIYSATAKTVRATGRVEVQVIIDETGRVTSASVISGNPLLRDSALTAARKSTFSPTKLSDVPVKVSGIIVYNFTL